MRLVFVWLALQVAVGQTTERTISVPVTRTVALQLDEVRVAINVSADSAMDPGLVVDALAFTGVQAADLVLLDPQSPVTHGFRFTRPAEEFGNILFGLRELQTNRPEWLKDLSFAMALSVSGEQIKAVRWGLLPSVEKEGRAAAERLAKGIGVRVGALLASDLPDGVNVFAGAPASGDFFRVISGIPVPSVATGNSRVVFPFQLIFAMESI